MVLLMAVIFLAGFVTNYTSFTLGEKQGPTFVARVISYQLDDAVRFGSVGHVYQALRLTLERFK